MRRLSAKSLRVHFHLSKRALSEMLERDSDDKNVRAIPTALSHPDELHPEILPSKVSCLPRFCERNSI